MNRDDDEQRTMNERVDEFLAQIRRYRAGALTEEAFRPLRLQNGLYVMREAPMLRIGIPYGVLSSTQLRCLARIARTYDRGYGHFTTRQNVQLNWVAFEDVPEILTELAAVRLYSVRTSGNCIRNITSDPFAGVAADERIDPRPWCEILRRWSLLHPDFGRLPRKLKIAVSGAPQDRALIRVHDIGLEILTNDLGEPGFRVLVGGGLGRNPALAQELEPFLPWRHLVGFCEAIVRVYDRHGRRDDPYKARLKTLAGSLGMAELRRLVMQEWARLADGPLTLTEADLDPLRSRFREPPYQDRPEDDVAHRRRLSGNPAFAAWARRSTHPHRRPGYRIVTLSTKHAQTASGDLSSDQMEQVADWADDYSFGEVRVTHEQNLVFPHVRKCDLYPLWESARAASLASPNRGLLTDIIACPGGRYCDLAKADSIGLAQAIQARFADSGVAQDIGELALNVSGCVNGCAHHAVAHIGIRGVEKNDRACYQISIGGDAGAATRFGTVIGPALAGEEVPAAVERLIGTYLSHRRGGERFVETGNRLGTAPFRRAVYGAEQPIVKVANG